MSDKTITTTVFCPAGKVSRGDILAQALFNVKDDIPKATLPLAEINVDKTEAESKKTKKGSEPGTTYVVDVTYRDLGEGEDVTIDEVIHGHQAPTSFNPDDVGDDAA
jgi:hypothetical protein